MLENSHSVSHFLLHWVVAAVGVLLTAKLIKGFQVSGFFSALFAAVMIGLVNTFIWPALIFLTLPLNVLTLGFFTFVVNGACLKIAAALLPGFAIDGWLSAIFGSIVLTVISTILHYFFV